MSTILLGFASTVGKPVSVVPGWFCRFWCSGRSCSVCGFELLVVVIQRF
uniref:Uncharacterized protein n=1 Tax=Arundo donax TaxID=35708 RepID=A0A0A9GG65_ARUDO